MPSSEIETLLDKHESLKYDESKNKVVCQLTKHEMPPTVAAMESYLNGKKYRKAAENAFDINQYKPHIVPSTKRKHLQELFCFLTLRHVARTRQAVERHVSGKRYKRALARWTKCQESGEKFVPRGGKRKTRESDNDSGGGRGAPNWSDDSPNEGQTDDDDLEDLYPAEVFGRASDDDDDDESSEDEDIEAEENLPTASTNHNSDADSDYDLKVMDGAGDAASSNGKLEKNAATGNKNRMKKKKLGKKKNGTSSVISTEKRTAGNALLPSKADKRKIRTDTDGPRLKKKKIKNC